MTAIGGSLESISLNGREFKCTADTDPGIQLGGEEITMESNGLGGVRELKRKIPWAINGAKVELDMDNEDLEYLTDFQINKGGDVVITFAGGISYTAIGNISGTLESNPADASTTLSLMGGGLLKRL